MPSKYQYILFDMDGVLIDSEQAIREACIQALSKYGVSAVHSDFIPFTGMGEDRFIGGVAEKYGLVYTAQMKDDAYAVYEQLPSEKLFVYDGVKELIVRVRELGCKIAVASAADAVKVGINLRRIGLAVGDFDAVVTGSDITHKKPNPEIFITAGNKIGAKKGKTLVVEDAVSGTQAGVAAGFDVAAVTTSFPAEKLREAGARYIVSKTPEILSLLD